MRLAPSVSYDQAFTARLSSGFGGTLQTLSTMRALVREGRISPLIRDTARNVIFLTPEKDELHEARTLYEFVRDSIRYMKDVHEVETLSSAEKTLESRAGDCDDQTVLLASLLESVGYPTRFVVAGYNEPGKFEHVYLQVALNGEWFDCDPTEQAAYFGWGAPQPVALYMERV